MKNNNARKISPRINILHTFVLCLLALLVLSSTLAGRLGLHQTQEVINKNWRGTYDILATAPTGLESIQLGKQEQGFSLIDENYAAQTLPLISAEHLEKLNKISGIDVAAPAGFVGLVGNTSPWPIFSHSVASLREKPVQTYRIHWKMSENDGLGERLLFERSNTIKIDASAWNGQAGYAPMQGVKVTNDFAPNDRFLLVGNIFIVDEHTLTIGWARGPAEGTSIVAIDPVKEAALLGKDGAFLRPLIDFDQSLQDRNITERYIHEAEEKGNDPPLLSQLQAFPGAIASSRPALANTYGLDNPLVAYLRNTEAYPPAALSVDIEAINADGNPGEKISRSWDYGTHSRPFLSQNLALEHNGAGATSTPTSAQESYFLNSDYLAGTLDPIRYNLKPYPHDDEEIKGANGNPSGFEALQKGVTIPFQTPSSALSSDEKPQGNGIGQHITYRASRPTTVRVGTRDLKGAAPFEVGTFTPHEGHPLATLGLYGKASAELSATGEKLLPMRTGHSLVTQAPSAIISLKGAQYFTDQSIISVVRIRVKGLDGLSRQEGMDRISKVAREIRALGLEATIMAGSSRTSANIFVPSYAFGTLDPQSEQKVGELGWITRQVTATGVASWAADFTESTIAGVILLCLLVGSVATLGIAVLSRQERRTTHALLSSLGWSLPRRLAWVAREEWPGLLLLAITIPISFALSSGSQRWGICAVLACVAIAFGVANPIHAHRLSLSLSIGTRARIIFLTLSEGISTGISAVIIGVVAAIADTYRRQVGSTQLGNVVLLSLLPAASALVVVGLIIVATAFATSRKNENLYRARANFSYWVLGKSRIHILLPQMLRILCALLVAFFLCLLAFYETRGYAINQALFISGALGWMGIFFLIRCVSIMRWKPRSLSN